MNPNRTTHFVLYDGECSLCTFQMRVITWLDWFNTVTLVPVANPLAAELAPQLTREAARGIGGSREETPNTKIQTPKKLQTSRFKACREPDCLRLNRCRHVKWVRASVWPLAFEVWCLELGVCLEFGSWDLVFTSAFRVVPGT